MKYITGKNRNQLTLFPVSLDDSIAPDNEVRFIDLFVESLDIASMGFREDHVENGRPAYHPKDLLKLYIYGYLNRIRSSRELEKESKRNIEVMWLIKGLTPDHNTISNFRRDNPKAIKKVFRETVRIARNFDLIGGKLLAGDSTKLRAQNSKKNNFNEKKIKRHLDYIDKKLSEYEEQLAQEDGDDHKETEAQIEKHQNRKKEYQEIERQLKDTGESQISTSDPDSRHLIIRNNITEVAYNVQTTVDAKYNLPIDYKVTNKNDTKAMGNMLRRAKSILRSHDFTVLYDKGYHTGSEFNVAEHLGIDVLVAIPGIPRTSQAPDIKYNVENFLYSSQNDSYKCPQGHEVVSNGSWYQGHNYRFKQYKTPACRRCPARDKCTKSVQNGRIIQRSEYTSAIERNRDRIENNKDYYRRRQAIVEHPYGTIKRQWGFGFLLTKKFINKAEADVGLMFTAYNLRRLFNILGKDVFRNYLKNLLALFFFTLCSIDGIISHYKQLLFLHNILGIKSKHLLKTAYI